ncbi:MAG: chromatin protein Cren7 [Candidatus Njordarchaeia archaeon]
MARKKTKKIKCKKCGTILDPKETHPERTWHLISPMPDKEGRITVTLMGIWTCPSCGAKIRGVVSKIKVGDEGKSINRRELLIQELSGNAETDLKDIAERLGFKLDTIKKAVNYFIKKGIVKGRIEGEKFIRASG